MQRSKAAVSVEVKQVITALCKLLSASGLEDVPAPETFRLAKFGAGPEEGDQFWKLLTNILQTAGIVSCEAQAQFGGENCKFVAAGLWQTGYYADWMIVKEGGGVGKERRCSSRELLLALGWLIAAGTVEKLVSQRVKKLDRTLFTPQTAVNTQFPNELQIDSSSLRKLQWLVGSLRHQNRILLSMQEERTHLLHAVFLASLSFPESSSEQTSAVLKEDCVCMQGLCELLESYLNWKQVEKVFWTWMDSVLDCHLTDPVVAERPPQKLRGSAKVCHHGNRGLEKMEDMLQRLPTRQKGQRRCRAAAGDRGEGGAEALQAGSDTSSLPHLLPSLSSLHTFPQVYRARLQTSAPVKCSSRPTDGAHGGAEAAEELPASQAAQLLLQMEALLLQRRDTQRLANRMQLQEVVSRQEELVLIPP